MLWVARAKPERLAFGITLKGLVRYLHAPAEGI